MESKESCYPTTVGGLWTRKLQISKYFCSQLTKLYRSPPSILTLLELHKICPEVFDHLEVYIDGGIRRGTDIFKALCLGAKAVGIGRPYLYALNYGPEGISHLTQSMLIPPVALVKANLLTDLCTGNSTKRRARDDDADVWCQ